MVYAFTRYDYKVSVDELRLDAVAKPSQPKGRADDTIKNLWQAQAKLLVSDDLQTLERIDTFRTFTHELSSHLEASYRRRYWIFGEIFIFFGCGPLGALKSLEVSFETEYRKRVAQQREAVIRRSHDPLQPLPLSQALSKISPLLRNQQWYKMGLELLSSHAMAMLGRPELRSLLINTFALIPDQPWYLPLIDTDGYEQLIDCLKELPQAKGALDFVRKRKEVEEAKTVQDLLTSLQTVDPLFINQSWFKRAIGRLATLTLELAHDPTHKLVPKSLAFIVQNSPTHEILQALCAKNSRFSRLTQLFEQLLSFGDKIQMQKSDLFKQAYFIEFTLPKLSGVQFKKSDECPRSILRDKDTVYIQLKRKSPILFKEGLVKKVSAAIMVPALSQELSLVAQATTRDEIPEHILKDVKKEFKITQELQGQEGIWPAYCLIEHKKFKEGKEIAKISQFSPLADGDLSSVANSLNFEEMHTVSKTLLCGLGTLHQRSYVHADIKGANALLKKRADGSFHAGWTDFGTTFKLFKDSPPKCFEVGLYGTHNYTAPEVFGVQGFHGNFFLADVWAFGLMLYRRYLKREPSWSPLIEDHLKISASYEQKDKMKQMVVQEIDSQLNELVKKSNPSREDRFRLMILKMLKEKPSDRPDVKQALKELE